ncbi:MAG: DUF2793 domain-containing protein [Alphaproteobacteria bacterium]|nr:DUF2793 domain-containing protein [Alphaproteobacteria bacterium]
MNTSNLALPYLAAAQAQKHVTVNEAFDLLDSVVQLAVESRALTAPPASPADGACYIPASGAGGAWTAWDFNLAVWRDGAWSKLVPKDGWKAWIKDERLGVVFQDGVWRDGIALTPHGGRITLRAKEEELTLAGSYTETADAAFLPSRAIVLAVAARTTQQIAGAASYDVGIAGEQSKFGGSLGIAAGSVNIGVVGPTATYANARVRVTANGGSFTAGKVRLIAYFLEITAPTS